MKKPHIVTLGVHNIKETKAFLENLFGWRPKDYNEQITFYDMGCWIVAIHPFKNLAEDIGESSGVNFSVPGGFTMAHNEPSKADVDRLIKRALDLGAELAKKPQEVSWGGYSGYIKDLNGHFWEIAYNPYAEILENGKIKI